MSIPTKITSIENHLTEAYDKLDELGVDLTNVDKNLNNIAELLDGVYEDYPKTTTTNVTEPSINNTKAGKMEIDLKGNTEQFTTTGKNLFYLPEEETINGITYTINKDGTINLVGTATANVALLIYKPLADTKIEATTYTFWATNAIPSGVEIRLEAFDNNWQRHLIGQVLSSSKQSATGTANITDTTRIRNSIHITSGTTVNILNLGIQLEQGSTATSFEPYTNGVSPNPDYPQKVEVVSGENTVKVVNKNLFDKNAISVGYLSNDGSITSDNVYRTSDFIKVKGNTDYYKTYTASPRTKFYDKNKQVLDTSTYQDISIGGNAGTFTTPSNAVYFRFSFPISGGSAVDIDTIQLELGSTATTYVEHKEQDLPISLHSRNLLEMNATRTLNGVTVTNNGDGSITVNGTATTTMDFFIANGLEVQIRLVKAIPNGTTLTQRINEISGSYSGGSVFIETVTYNGTSNNYTNLRGDISYTFTYDGWIKATDMYIQSGVKFENWTIKPQLEYGSAATEYQPFYDYELCKIGDYQDCVYKTSGKNLFNKNNSSIVWSGNTTVIYSSIYLGPGTYTMSSPDMPVFNEGKNMFILPGQVTTGAISSTNGVDKNTPRTVTTEDGYITIANRYAYGGSTGLYHPQDYSWMIEQGSIPTTYEPYGTGDWYIKSYFQKIYFDSNTQFGNGTASTDGYARIGYGRTFDIGYKGNNILGVYCNKLKGVIQNDNTPNLTGQHWYVSNAEPDSFRIMFRSGDSSLTSSQLSNLLKTSNVYIICFRVTVQDIPITDSTLINQLNNLYNAKSYDNQTNIIQENNDLPFKLDVTTLSKEAI